jgi:DNA-directed RNA polymerase specialized sigma24 family protein
MNNINDAFEQHDMVDIIRRMNIYAEFHLKKVPLKTLQGMTTDDFVSNVIVKVLSGVRKFENVQCSFKSFLFECLRSEISHFIEKSARCGIKFLPILPGEYGLYGDDSDDKDKYTQPPNK